MDIKVGDPVWIRADLRVGDVFPYTMGGVATEWRATITHCNYAGCAAMIKQVHARHTDFFRIDRDGCQAWFHVGMIQDYEGSSIFDVNQDELLLLIGGSL